MEASSKSPRNVATELRRKNWNDQRSPERNKVWIEPRRNRRVPVVYYLCRNGQLEHPHFVEVPISSSDGLYLRDVIDRLDSLRGKGMPALYSWSSKRSYKNGFVWHDLAENDFIYPVHGQEYILKGSELFDGSGASFGSKSDDASSNTKKASSSDTPKSVDEFDFSVGRSRRNQSWSSIDLHEYKVYSGESSAVRITTATTTASTQTDSNRHRRREMINEVEDDDNAISELSRNEISPPPSDSSTETLESLMKSDGRIIVRSESDDVNPTAGSKMKASSVLMQLISCGSLSFRDCGPGASGSGKESPGFSFSLELNPKAKMLPRGEDAGDRVVENGVEGGGENGVVLERKKKNSSEKMVEDKEYFSGSLIETKKDEFPVLMRSNSYNANG